MKLFVCMCAFFAVANAGFLGLLKGGNGGGSNFLVQGGQSHYSHNHGYVHSSPPKIFKVKIINEHVSAPILAPAPAVKVIKVIHQESSRGYGGHGPLVAGPAPEVIKLIHENAVGNSASFTGGPAKVIRVIHEQAHAPAEFAGSASAVAPQRSFLPPVQTPAAAFSVPAPQYGVPAPQYVAPAPQYIAPAPQYIAPAPQYSAETAAFTAPEPVPIATHVPAQSYGPPHK